MNKTDRKNMRAIFLLDIGIQEDTVIYELVPKEVACLKGYTLQGIVQSIKSFADRPLVLVDSGDTRILDALREYDISVIGVVI